MRTERFPTLAASGIAVLVKFGCLAAAALAALIGILGQGGRFFPVLDSLNHLAPLWLLLGAMGSCGLLLFRGWRGAGLTVLLLMWVLAGINIGGEVMVQTSAPEPGLRLVQFNVLKQNRTPDAAAAWILEQQPDVVVLEEAALAGAKVRDLVRLQLPFVTDCLGSSGERCSTMILSRVQPLDSGGLARGDPENQAALSGVWARFKGPAGDYTLFGVHLGRPWPYGDQSADVTRLVASVRSVDRRHAIVVGDFNQTPWTFGGKAIASQLGLRSLAGGIRTWPITPLPGASRMTPPLLPIDRVYVGSGWSMSEIDRGPDLGSDHLPLVTSLIMKPPVNASSD